MQRLDLEGFRRQTAEYDARVERAGYLDRFCSCSDWVLPAHEGLMPEREPVIYRDADSWLVMARGVENGELSYLEPFEGMWTLTCPLVAAGPELLLYLCEKERFDVMLVAGFFDHSPMQRRVLQALIEQYDVRQGRTTTRHVADLSAGLDPYLARRSRNFRRSLARARRRAAEAGIEIDIADGLPADAAYQRVLAVESLSWKGRDGVGITTGSMREFYKLMTARLSARGALRLRFATRDGQDVAYILGGVFADTYRGLQFSYDAELSHVGLGNLLQLEQMQALCGEGTIADYDLGTTGGDYKRRWTDREVESTMFFVVPR